MKTLILPLVILAYVTSSAQSVSIVFGPLEDSVAGVIHTYENATVDVELWIRTAPDIYVIGLHLPLSSKDDYIQSDSRDGGELYLPEGWETSQFLDPHPDSVHIGYTYQTLMASAFPDPMNGINTQGRWLKIASYRMAAAASNQFDTPLCDAFIEGIDPLNGGIVVAVYPGEEIDPSLDFACLEFEHFCGNYIVGDYNGNGSINVADLIAALSYLQTCAPEAAVMCQCPPGQGEEFAVAFDLNNTCTFDLIDYYLFMEIFPDTPWLAEPCEYCAPPN